MSVFTHLSRNTALVAIIAGACSLFFVATAQAGHTGKLAGGHKRQLDRESYFGHLTGVAAAWVSGQCDQPLQSELPPCIYPTLPAGSPYYYEGWPYYRSGWWRPGPTFGNQ